MRNRIAHLAGALALFLALPAYAHYVGDFAVGTDNICRMFNTYRPSTGAAFTLASAAVDVYKDDNTTQDNDSGLTIDDDFDAVTGVHQVCVDTSADGTFYSAGSMFTVILSGGTVDGVSVVGTAVMSFSLAKGSAFTRLGAPAGATVSADVAAVVAAIAALNNLSQAQAQTAAAAALNAENGANFTAIPPWSWPASWDADVQSEVQDALNAAVAEPGSVPAANASLLQKVAWLYALARNELRQTSSQSCVRNDANSSNVGCASVSDDGTTFTREEYQ